MVFFPTRGSRLRHRLPAWLNASNYQRTIKARLGSGKMAAGSDGHTYTLPKSEGIVTWDNPGSL
jgi:hypothetical protein